METAAKKTEFTGNVESYTMDGGIKFVFREEPKKEGDWAETINLPFTIYEKFKGNKVKITVEKIKE